MHYEFEGWRGDDLLTTFPEFVVTERLATALERAGLSGFALTDVEVSAGEAWRQLHGSRSVPDCRWLKVTGRAGAADLGLTELAHLVVSPSALQLLRGFSLQACEVTPWPILIVGATGGTGRHLVTQALERGHLVTAFTRNRERVPTRHPRLVAAQGDVLHYRSLDQAVRGQGAVISALGHKRWFYPNRILSTGTGNLVRAMETHGVRRLICETALGIGDTRGRAGLYYTLFVAVFILPFYFHDKERQEAIIRGSSLDWVIVRPGRLTNGRRRRGYRHGSDVGHRLWTCRISRADVADFMLRQLGDDSYLRRSPGVCW
jgi:putative NADH-flavin reductase